MAEIKRVALVDDNPEFLDLLEKELRNKGYDVIPKPIHQNVFHEIKEQRPDVIICDMGLDYVTAGWALVDMLYLDPETRPIPMILCAIPSQQIREAVPAFAGKGIVWLEKPFRIEALLALLDDLKNESGSFHLRTRIDP